MELVETQPRRGSVEHFYEATDLVDDVPRGRTALGMGRAEGLGVGRHEGDEPVGQL